MKFKNIKSFFLGMSLAFLWPAMSVAQGDVKKQVDDLDNRVTELEINSSQSKVNVGAELRSLNAHFKAHGIPGTNGIESNSSIANAILFRLNINSKLHENLSAYASFDTFSFFNDTFFVNQTDSMARTTPPKGDRLIMTKAYFDWRIFPFMTFSAGRLPTMQGPPDHYKEGVGRLGTYPITAFSVPLDGAAMSFNLHQLFGMQDSLILRAIYTPTGYTERGLPWRRSQINNPEAIQMSGDKQFGGTGMLEYESSRRNFLTSNILAIAQYGNYTFGSGPGATTTGLYPGDYNTYHVYLNGTKSFKTRIASLYLGMDKILGTNFDFYATGNITKSQSLADLKYKLLNAVAGGASVGGGYRNNIGGPTGTVGAFIHDGSKHGSRMLVGTKYSFTDSFYAGFEFTSSTVYATPSGLYSDHIYNYNLHNGSIYHPYIGKSFYNKALTVALGHIRLKQNGDLSGYVFSASQQRIQTTYLNFNLRF